MTEYWQDSHVMAAEPSAMTGEETPSAEEDHEVWLKAPNEDKSQCWVKTEGYVMADISKTDISHSIQFTERKI